MRLTLFSLGVLLGLGCSKDVAPVTGQALDSAPAATTPASTAPASLPTPTGALVRVEPSSACMVTNKYMGKPQIPVEVEGKTYFGCCEMCKKRLASELTTRTATDPQTGANVDKATAVIARNADGDLFYFETQASMEAYNKKRI